VLAEHTAASLRSSTRFPGSVPPDPPQWLAMDDAVRILASAPRGVAGMGQRAAAAVAIVAVLDPNDALALVGAARSNHATAGMSLDLNAQPPTNIRSTYLAAFWTALDLPETAPAAANLNAKTSSKTPVPSSGVGAAAATEVSPASSGKVTNSGEPIYSKTGEDTSAKVAVSPRLRPKASPPRPHSRGSPRSPPAKRVRSPGSSPSSSPPGSSSSLTSASMSSYSSSTFSSPTPLPRTPRMDSIWRLDDQPSAADTGGETTNLAAASGAPVLATSALQQGRLPEAAALVACIVALLAIRGAAHAASRAAKASEQAAAEAVALAAYLRHACPPRFSQRAHGWSAKVMRSATTNSSGNNTSETRQFGATTRGDASTSQRLHIQDDSDDKDLFNAVRLQQ